MNSGIKYTAAVVTAMLVVVAVVALGVRAVASGSENLRRYGLLTTDAAITARAAEPVVGKDARPSITTRWTVSRTTTHAVVTVEGRVPSSIARVVYLQQWLPSGWRTVSESKTNSNGRFRLPLPTGWVYSTKLRVAAPGVSGGSSPLGLDRVELTSAVSDARRFTVAMPYEPAGRSDAFKLQPGNPRFNPCAPIPYRVNVAHAPKGAVQRVHNALARVTEASGLTFHYEGTTTDHPSTSAANDRPGILVAWGAIPEEPRAEGAAGPTRIMPASDARGDAHLIHSSQVVIATKFKHSPYELEDLLTHELGHAVGLSHDPHALWVLMGSSEDLIQEQKMAAMGHTGNTRWGAGDLNGFSKVGMASGCISFNTADVRP